MLKAGRAFEKREFRDGKRIIIGRLWSQGIAKTEDRFEEWTKDPSPGGELAATALTAALEAHTAYLKQHLEALESLTKSIKQLEMVIKKDVHESGKPSRQLKEAVKSFVDYNINPDFYQDSGYLKLKTGYQMLFQDFTVTKLEKSSAKRKIPQE